MSDPLSYHAGRPADWFDAQYNLRISRPDYEETVIPRWVAESEAARQKLRCALDIRYGKGEKQKLDVFSCGDPSAPVLIYVHGGYWQRGDKSIYSFLAPPFVGAGVNVVVIGYDLCPTVTITQISAELRAGLAYVWRNAADLGLNPARLHVMGHSAGGHITQMMMATHWPDIGADLPADLLKAGLPISPLSYLEPIRLTQVLNAVLGLDVTEAEAESPMTNHPPATDAPQLVIVGGAETKEFRRQARMYVEKYATPARRIELYDVPDVDHFDILNVLADPASPFFQKTCGMLGL